MLVLGPSDGREALTGVARRLSEQVQQHRLAATDVDINLLNDRLIGIYHHTLSVVHTYTRMNLQALPTNSSTVLGIVLYIKKLAHAHCSTTLFCNSDD